MNAFTDLGSVFMVAGLMIAIYSGVVAIVGYRRGRSDLVASATNGVLVMMGLVTLSSLILLYAFLSRDFGVKYVAMQSSKDMSLILTVAAFWGGQEGSLLFWAWTLSLFTAWVVFTNRRRYVQLMPYVIAVLMAVEAFFLLALSTVVNPFLRYPYTPADGLGLNPLLHDGGMFIHPPMLLLGYMGFTIPYAFAIAALITGRLGNEWIKAVRQWTLIAWVFQGLGLLFGAWWAYHVLGWGGYWGWDPVENAALLPWLTATAFLHSVMVQERRGMLKTWNMVLIIATFALAIMGTFIVRSGVLVSVHSFAESAIGPLFLIFLALILLFSLVLLFYRLPKLQGEQEFDALLSKESSFLLNNLLLVGVAFAVLWGTLFPLISEAVRGVKITVGPPFYNQVNGPILGVLVMLMGIGPLLAWRRVSRQSLVRNFRGPLGAGLVIMVVLAVLGMRDWVGLLGSAASVFTLGTIMLEYLRGVRARHRNSGESYPKALVTLVARYRRRYGGYIVHLGMVLLALGVMGSVVYQRQAEAVLAPGESLSIGRYDLTYQGLRNYLLPGIQVSSASLAVVSDGRSLGTVQPEKRFHRNWENQPVSKLVIETIMPWMEDLYIVFIGPNDDGTATFRVFVNPLVSLVWVGGIVFFLGSIVAMWPEAEPRRLPVTRPTEGAVAREV